MDIADQLEARFLRYVAVDTQSDASATVVPSTSGQWQLAKLLQKELIQLGVKGVEIDEYSNVTAKIVANCPAPSIGFVAHLDTVDVGLSSVIKAKKIHYTGQEIVMNSELNLIFDKKLHPEIEDYIGDDIFISDGTSVLGADNKAAIAIVMTLVEQLVSTEKPHGDIHIAFVADEEIGLRGAKKLDLNRFNPDYAYTIDCCVEGEVVYETFNAASSLVDIKGVTAHPMSAKGVLVNPVSVAKFIIDQFNPQEVPEHTELREGYVWFTHLNANPCDAQLQIAIRDHDMKKFAQKKMHLQQIIEMAQKQYPTAVINCNIEDVYANIANYADENHPAVSAIYQALNQLNIPVKTLVMRGGTDGSALTQKGLVTPNYFTGAHNFHSKFEFLPLSSFINSYRVTERLIANACQTSAV